MLDPQAGDSQATQHLDHDPVGVADGLPGHVAEVEVGDAVLEVTEEPHLEITAQGEAELVLVDVSLT